MPRARVVFDDLQHRATFVSHQLVLRERTAQQRHRLPYLRESSFAQALLVQRVAAYEMVSQGTSRPDPKLGSLWRLDAIANGNNDIEAIKRCWPVRKSNVH